MSILEALTVTVLGMIIVFFGLCLCILFINAFNRVAKRVKWEGIVHGQAGHAEPESVTAAPAIEPIPAPKPKPKPQAEPPTPEILAVIASVLEIDQRLYQSSGVQRLTIRRAAPESR